MNKFSFCMGLVQLIIGLTLFCYIVQTVAEFQAVRNKIQFAMADSEIYMLRDMSSEKKFDKLVNDDAMLPKLGELYEYAENMKNTIAYSADSSMGLFLSGKTDIPKQFVEYSGSGSKKVPMVSVTKQFFSTYDISGDFGEDALESFFEKRSDGITPVFLGEDYKKYYQKGDIFTDAKDREYQVLGFLEPNSYYVAPAEGKELIDLKRYVVRPDYVDKEDSTSLIQFFDSVYFMTNDRDDINALIKKSKELGLFDFELINFSYQLEVIIADYLDQVFVNTTFLVLVLIFAAIGIIGNLLQFISDHKKEFAIHLMSGADKGRVVAGIFMQIALMVGISDVVVFILFGVSGEFFVTVGFSVFFLLSVLLYPTYILSRMTIQTMLKRSYE